MKELIKYLEMMGYEDANTNFLFIKAIVESTQYDPQFGMDKNQYTQCKKLLEGVYC
jgi:hypothetical protein